MAGLACADVLAGRALDVWLFDKGRGPGGRMSTRRIPTPLGEATFDHGAQYFTARDPGFLEVVDAWERRGIVAPWPAADAAAWVGVPAMNTVIGDMASRHAVALGNHVECLESANDGWHFKFRDGTAGPFDIAVLATPAEQAATHLSLQDFDMARVALRARSEPCWTGLFAFDQPLAAEQDTIRDKGIVAWAARNSAKPGRRSPEAWVVQANRSWSAINCDSDRAVVSRLLLDALRTGLGGTLPEPIAATAHLWRFAMSDGTGDLALWNSAKRLGACGDWLHGPRVESAWLSGQALGQRIIETVDTGSALRSLA
jgi:predicted NAD/FAD-dependent oxidoreductase